jgi:hypothetical protein
MQMYVIAQGACIMLLHRTNHANVCDCTGSMHHAVAPYKPCNVCDCTGSMHHAVAPNKPCKCMWLHREDASCCCTEQTMHMYVIAQGGCIMLLHRTNHANVCDCTGRMHYAVAPNKPCKVLGAVRKSRTYNVWNLQGLSLHRSQARINAQTLRGGNSHAIQRYEESNWIAPCCKASARCLGIKRVFWGKASNTLFWNQTGFFRLYLAVRQRARCF